SAGRDLRAAAERLVGPVEWLVITHGDFDHYGGSAAFADVPILASEGTAAAIAEDGPGRGDGPRAGRGDHLAELERRDAPPEEREQACLVAADLPDFELALPTETFTGTLELGTADVIECGAAHTASDSVVWLPEARVLFAGDLATVGNHL